MIFTMTHHEAKFLLQAYRSGELDAADPALVEALEQVRRDPALAAWFAQEQAHAAATSAKLREIQPPAGLRDTIVAAMRAGSRRRARLRRWRNVAWTGLAAAAAVLICFAAWWRFAPIPGATLEDYAVNYVDRGFFLQERSPEVGELKAWLAARGSPLPHALPTEFARLRALGCRTLEFDGREVSLVCFERGGHEYHVFVAQRRDLAAPPAPRPAEPRERRGHVYTAWSDAANDYVLVSDASLEEVRRLL